MKREIKFEYGFESINGIIKKRYYLHEIPDIQKKCDVFNILPLIYVRQFTGSKDKNDKEIYEGDIVRILYTDWMSKSESDERTMQQYLIDISNIGVIEFNEDRFSVKIENKYNSIFPGRYGYIEVIGNIFENPELLK